MRWPRVVRTPAEAELVPPLPDPASEAGPQRMRELVQEAAAEQRAERERVADALDRLAAEITALRQRVAGLEAAAAEPPPVQDTLPDDWWRPVHGA